MYLGGLYISNIGVILAVLLFFILAVINRQANNVGLPFKGWFSYILAIVGLIIVSRWSLKWGLIVGLVVGLISGVIGGGLFGGDEGE